MTLFESKPFATDGLSRKIYFLKKTTTRSITKHAKTNIKIWLKHFKDMGEVFTINPEFRILRLTFH